MSLTAKGYMAMATFASMGSDDPNRQVGAVIVKGGLCMLGSNKMPEGVRPLPERLQPPLKYLYIEHAERDAIARARRALGDLWGAEMYLPWFPCAECARAIEAAGIRKLYCYREDFSNPKWGRSWQAAEEILIETGVEIIYMPREEEVAAA